MPDERLRLAYETSGRAIHAWMADLANALPADLRSTTTLAPLETARTTVRANYYRARELWNEGKHAEAANLMTTTAVAAERMQDDLDRIAQDLLPLRVFFAQPAVRSAITLLREGNRAVRAALTGVANVASAGLGLGIGIAAIALILALGSKGRR